MILRDFQKQDQEAVERIFDLYWRGGPFREHLTNKIEKYFSNDLELTKQKFKFFVAEENGEIVGIAGMRTAPENMRQYSTTPNVAEFYVLAVKYKGKNIGDSLVNKRIEEAKKEGYTEVVIFSGESHKDAWGFHDKYYSRAGQGIAPNGELGFIWRRVL